MTSKKMKICADCITDDGEKWVLFDAMGWFKRATVDEIVKLMSCGFGGDYPADEVALGSKGIEDLFEYVQKTQVGFECYVNREDALEWIKNNRKDVLMILPLYIHEANRDMENAIQHLLKDVEG